jgi:hypothetical protein
MANIVLDRSAVVTGYLIGGCGLGLAGFVTVWIEKDRINGKK